MTPLHISMEHQMSDETWLVLGFTEDLSASIRAIEPTDRLTIAGITYESSANSTVTAFYSRILDSAGVLIGIEVCPIGDLSKEILSALPMRRYLRISANQVCFQVLFLSDAALGLESQGDQAFGGKFFRSPTGEVAMSLDLGYLLTSDDELTSLKSYPAHWFP